MEIRELMSAFSILLFMGVFRFMEVRGNGKWEVGNVEM